MPLHRVSGKQLHDLEEQIRLKELACDDEYFEKSELRLAYANLSGTNDVLQQRLRVYKDAFSQVHAALDKGSAAREISTESSLVRTLEQAMRTLGAQASPRVNEEQGGGSILDDQDESLLATDAASIRKMASSGLAPNVPIEDDFLNQTVDDLLVATTSPRPSPRPSPHPSPRKVSSSSSSPRSSPRASSVPTPRISDTKRPRFCGSASTLDHAKARRANSITTSSSDVPPTMGTGPLTVAPSERKTPAGLHTRKTTAPLLNSSLVGGSAGGVSGGSNSGIVRHPSPASVRCATPPKFTSAKTRRSTSHGNTPTSATCTPQSTHTTPTGTRNRRLSGGCNTPGTVQYPPPRQPSPRLGERHPSPALQRSKSGGGISHLVGGVYGTPRGVGGGVGSTKVIQTTAVGTQTSSSGAVVTPPTTSVGCSCVVKTSDCEQQVDNIDLVSVEHASVQTSPPEVITPTITVINTHQRSPRSPTSSSSLSKFTCCNHCGSKITTPSTPTTIGTPHKEKGCTEPQKDQTIKEDGNHKPTSTEERGTSEGGGSGGGDEGQANSNCGGTATTTAAAAVDTNTLAKQLQEEVHRLQALNENLHGELACIEQSYQEACKEAESLKLEKTETIQAMTQMEADRETLWKELQAIEQQHTKDKEGLQLSLRKANKHKQKLEQRVKFVEGEYTKLQGTLEEVQRLVVLKPVELETSILSCCSSPTTPHTPYTPHTASSQHD